MSALTPGFRGGRRTVSDRVPPGQYLTEGFPVLSAGPTPVVDTGEWSFTVVNEVGERVSWDWAAFSRLPHESPTVDIHCVTRWSKLDTTWRGVSVDTLLAEVATAADFAVVHSVDGYTANVPLQDLTDGQAWVVTGYEGAPLAAEHGGPARFLVPHLYFWKSAKWVSGITLHDEDQPGFWERAGYHDYGDPWLEQRYQSGW
ncbi:molybdopterin-dependent oxidoreductase [Glycomyces sp. A-F 0318]|uniref:molybdopterin-dependent oxidoreductase n=1 Tax=Glycomyces amatae TaxID=2881355 RepID=UPI001E590675|nr:molybdopterin-dependent oxidoreductase [Glycomyces amatae]MCD0444205.1 molybdopterin-dependent oxidoreductase [Glycomyces amatae]